MDAVVVLPDHIHAIWTLPPRDPDFSTRWMLVKSAFSRRCAQTNEVAAPGNSRARRREQAIWQRRFWEHHIRDERDFASHVDHIHYNPVKHGYVSAAKDWPYSSFHRYVRLGLCLLDWGAAAPPSFPERVGME
jgi:putative transposase